MKKQKPTTIPEGDALSEKALTEFSNYLISLPDEKIIWFMCNIGDKLLRQLMTVRTVTSRVHSALLTHPESRSAAHQFMLIFNQAVEDENKKYNRLKTSETALQDLLKKYGGSND